MQMPTGSATSALELEKATCPICGPSDIYPIMMAKSMDNITDVTFSLARCHGCGLYLTSPRPAISSLGQFYESGFYEVQEKRSKKVLIDPVMNIFHLLRFRQVSVKRNKGKVLDVGCGKGKFLTTAARHGWEAWGIEPSKRSHSLIDEMPGVRIIGARFEDAEIPDDYFDVITMWHTLEHFSDPIDVLSRVRSKLKDDGLLLIRVPNINSWDFRLGKERWFHLDIPRHLYHYSPLTLSLLLSKAGFRAHSLSTASLEDNPIGVLQTFMSICGFPAGSIFEIIKVESKDDSLKQKTIKPLKTLLAAFALATPSLLFSTVAALSGNGNTITIIADKSGYTSDDGRGYQSA